MRAIIGGTGTAGLYKDSEKRMVITGFGEIEVFLLGDTVFIPRHRAGHSLPPHKINYKGEFAALVELGISSAVGIYAVGSITEKIPPGKWGLLGQFADLSGRSVTMFDSKPVHTDMTRPFSGDLNRRIASQAALLGARRGPVADDAVYVQTNGPRLETAAEIRMFGLLGFDVVGMTCASEATLAREMGIEFAAAAYSINWGAGLGEGRDVGFIGEEESGAITGEMASVLLSL